MFVLCLALSLAGIVRADDADENRLREQLRADARQLTHRVGEQPGDMFLVLDKVVRLDESQTKNVAALRGQFDKESRAKDTDAEKLGKVYTNKLRRMLSDEQRRYFDEASGALANLQKARIDSAAEFMAAADPGIRKQLGQEPSRINTSDLTVYIDMQECVRKELARLQKEMYDGIDEAMKGVEAPEGLTEGELRRWKARAYRKAQDEARASYVQQRDALLSPAQRESLRRLEEAATFRRQHLRTAYGEAAKRLEAIMAEAAGLKEREADARPSENPEG